MLLRHTEQGIVAETWHFGWYGDALCVSDGVEERPEVFA